MQDGPSRRVIEQRCRNRIIEHLQITADYDVQRRYQAAVPFVNVAYEVINGWEDWVSVDPRLAPEWYDAMSVDERRALGEFHAVWESVADAVPDDYPELADVQSMPEWDQLRRAALNALEVFAERGFLSDDEEEVY